MCFVCSRFGIWRMMDLKIFIARYLKVATDYNRKGVENCIICDLAFFFLLNCLIL